MFSVLADDGQASGLARENHALEAFIPELDAIHDVLARQHENRHWALGAVDHDVPAVRLADLADAEIVDASQGRHHLGADLQQGVVQLSQLDILTDEESLRFMLKRRGPI